MACLDQLERGLMPCIYQEELVSYNSDWRLTVTFKNFLNVSNRPMLLIVSSVDVMARGFSQRSIILISWMHFDRNVSNAASFDRRAERMLEVLYCLRKEMKHPRLVLDLVGDLLGRVLAR